MACLSCSTNWRGHEKGKSPLMAHRLDRHCCMLTPILSSSITCPACGFTREEAMPENACVHFYECTNCHSFLHPRPGDCCVVCSYGSTRCPPRQRAGSIPNPDALAGRDLDIAVAQYVFGLEVEARLNTRTRERDAVGRHAKQAWARVALYGANKAASLNLEIRLEELGWKRMTRPRATGPQEVVLVDEDGRMVRARGESLSEALCRAALKAVIL